MASSFRILSMSQESSMAKHWRASLFLSVLALGAGGETVRGDLPPLIPRTVLFGNPEKANPQISPDGKHLAYVAPDKKDVLQVWVRDLADGSTKQITHDKK